MHELYCAFLFKARDQSGLSYLQPGGLCRGTLPDAPYLWFAPLDVDSDFHPLAPHSLGARALHGGAL